MAEALELRRELPGARIIVMGPTAAPELAAAREARLELVVGDEIPDGIPVHVKLDTGMGRWGISEPRRPSREVVGLMTHLATADTDPDFARLQLEGASGGDRAVPGPHPPRCEQRGGAAPAGVAVRRGPLRDRALRPLAVRHRPGGGRLEPVLSWTSELALTRLLRPGESTGYGRAFVAGRDTWIGIVPVGYADGFRRDLTGTQVLVDGEPSRVVGAVSMDAFAVELAGPMPQGTPVTLVGPGALR